MYNDDMIKICIWLYEIFISVCLFVWFFKCLFNCMSDCLMNLCLLSKERKIVFNLYKEMLKILFSNTCMRLLICMSQDSGHFHLSFFPIKSFLITQKDKYMTYIHQICIHILCMSICVCSLETYTFPIPNYLLFGTSRYV